MKFAAFDIDGTLFRWQLFHELVFTLKDMGCFDDETSRGLDQAFLAWRGWNMPFDEYEMYVVRAIETNLATIPPHGFDRAAKTIVEKSGHKVYKYTRDLITKLKDDGYHLIALSGSQQEIIEPFAELYGFDGCIGALYERKEGRFTGKKLRHIPGNKAVLLKEYVSENQLIFDSSVAVGDSAGDISMLEIVEQPIAFNPAHDLLEHAMQQGWNVVLERKNVAYALVPQSLHTNGSNSSEEAPEASVVPQRSYGYASGAPKTPDTPPEQSSGRQRTGNEALRKGQDGLYVLEKADRL